MKLPSQKALALLLCGALSAVASDYTVNATIKVAGDQGWDLLKVDDATERLFLSHGDKVDVVNLNSGTLAGVIANIQGAHDIALATGTGKGFITSGKDSTLVIFDTKTLATIQRLHLNGAKPDAIIYEPSSRKIFVGLAGSNSLMAIDPVTSQVVASIPLEGNPELMTYDGKGKLFVAVENKSQVVAIDAQTMKVISNWPLAPGEEPTGLAMDSLTNRIFAGCNNRLLIILDASSGKVVTQLPIGDHIDGVSFDPGLKRVYSSGGDGTLTVVQEDSPNQFRILTTVATKKGARTNALSAKTHHLYLPSADYGPTPVATTENPKPRPSILAGTFAVLDVVPPTP